MNKYTVWINYGQDSGWWPYEYETIKECLEHETCGYERKITTDVNYPIEEKDNA